jgi:hypothetical protein
MWKNINTLVLLVPIAFLTNHIALAQGTNQLLEIPRVNGKLSLQPKIEYKSKDKCLDPNDFKKYGGLPRQYCITQKDYDEVCKATSSYSELSILTALDDDGQKLWRSDPQSLVLGIPKLERTGRCTTEASIKGIINGNSYSRKLKLIIFSFGLDNNSGKPMVWEMYPTVGPYGPLTDMPY